MQQNQISINKLKELENDGWVKSQTHPTLPLTIWNYTPKTQWEEYWNEFTLICRGLVTDPEGNIVARPLKKFFNYEELSAKNKVPNTDFTVFDKMDGSYIQLFNYEGQWIVSSKGSFTSLHSELARDLLPSDDDLNNLSAEYNYIFELIHPDTRIVVDYGQLKCLTLIAVIKNSDGTEPYQKGLFHFDEWFEYVEEFVPHPMTSLEGWHDLKGEIPNNKEGYVVIFDSGERMKIKGEEYCRLHRIVTNTSSYDIWRILKEGLPMDDLLDRVPDEWMNWVYQTVGKMYMNFLQVKQQVRKDLEYGETNEGIHISEGFVSKPRREVAKYFNTCMYPSLMFSILDGKEYDSQIWEMIKPEHEKGFSI